MSTVAFNLFNLVKALEVKRGKTYPWAHISKDSGVHRGTLYNIRDNKTDSIDKKTIAKLLDFFAKEDMPIEAGELFTVTPPVEKGAAPSVGCHAATGGGSASSTSAGPERA